MAPFLLANLFANKYRFFTYIFKLCGLHPVKQLKWHHCVLDRGLAVDCMFVFTKVGPLRHWAVRQRHYNRTTVLVRLQMLSHIQKNVSMANLYSTPSLIWALRIYNVMGTWAGEDTSAFVSDCMSPSGPLAALSPTANGGVVEVVSGPAAHNPPSSVLLRSLSGTGSCCSLGRTCLRRRTCMEARNRNMVFT